jgi:hypothetical protein
VQHIKEGTDKFGQILLVGATKVLEFTQLSKQDLKVMQPYPERCLFLLPR